MPKPLTIRILLIEDNEVDIEHVRRALAHVSDKAHELREARTLGEGIAALEKDDVDVVLLDLALPDSEGLSTVEAIVEKADGAPIIVLTGAGDEEMAELAIRAGAHDFLPKRQVTPISLRRAVLHGSWRSERQRMTLAYESLRLEQRLERSERLAVIGQLAAGIAHELNNPAAFTLPNLCSVVSKLEHIAAHIADTEKPALAECLELARQSLSGVERMASIAKELKRFSRIDNHIEEPVRLHEVVRSACDITADQLRYSARLIIDHNADPLVSAERGNLIQVLVTLLLNAAHAIGQGAAQDNTIRVRLIQNNDLYWKIVELPR